MPLVELVDVSKTHAHGPAALRGLTFSLERGEFVSLLGASGCGKSTALRLIGGLDRPDGGAIRRAWDGAPRGVGQPVGCVFQDPTLMPWARVWDNVALPLRLAGVPRQRAADLVAPALARVGLRGAERAFPRELSGGMRMRVAVARALVTEPQLLMLDEPFAALDEITRMRLNDELLAWWSDRGWTALFVTHSVAEAVYLSSRVLVMSARPGRVETELHIDLPRPRNAATRDAPRFHELCRQASAALRAAMRLGDPDPAGAT